MGFEVDQDEGSAVPDGDDGLVGVRESGVHEVAHITSIVALGPFIDLFKREKQCLLSRLGIDGVALFHVSLYELVAPPRQKDVLRSQVVVVRAAEI